MISLKLYVAVEVYELIVQDVHIFKSEKQAKEWFRKYTGIPHDDFYENDEPAIEEYDQTKIFEVDINL